LCIYALKRIAHCLDVAGRLSVFRSFILSHMKYCNIIWHFCGKTNTNTFNRENSDYTSDYETLLANSGFPSLRLDRQRNIVLQTFKIVQNMSPQFFTPLVDIRNTGRNFRDALTLQIPLYQTHRFLGVHSFAYQAPRLWNTLSPKLRNADDLMSFRAGVAEWQGLDHL
jgi:hypothetical protein